MAAAGLIGRDATRARLADAAARAADGLGSLVLVAGPAGIGKTALIDDVLAGSPLAAVRATAPATARRRGARSSPPCARHAGATPASIAVPAHAGAAPRPPAPEPARPRTRATARRSSRPSSRRSRRWRRPPPAAVVVDDLQWADHATCELLPVLAAASADLPLLVLAAYRSEALPRQHPLRAGAPRPAAGRRAARARAAAARCRRHPGAGGPRPRRPAADAVAARLHARSGGVPFAVLELATALAAGADADAPLPETLREAVLSSLAGVPPEARAALEQAAALGVRFDLRLARGPGRRGRGAGRPRRRAARGGVARRGRLPACAWCARRCSPTSPGRAAACCTSARRRRSRRAARRPSRSPSNGSRHAAPTRPRRPSRRRRASRSRCTPHVMPWRSRSARSRPGRSTRPWSRSCWRSPAARRSRAASCRRRRTRWPRRAERPPGVAERIDALQHLAGVLELRGDWQRALDARLVAADELVGGGRPAGTFPEQIVAPLAHSA